jgi:hypothetical protein
MNLHELGMKHKTDKAYDHQFLDGYDNFFTECNIEVKTLIEVGIFDGNSLRMWRDYFPEAMIYGIDFEPRRLIYENKIKSFFGDQSKVNTISDIVKKFDCDVFIDDGSHFIDHQINTFNEIWPLLKKEAIYIMEDLHTSYDKYYVRNNPILATDFILKFVEDNNCKYSYIKNNNGNSISIIIQK